MLCTYNVTFRRVSVTVAAVENNKLYIFWVCVCRLRYRAWALLSSVACPPIQYFTTLSQTVGFSWWWWWGGTKIFNWA